MYFFFSKKKEISEYKYNTAFLKKKQKTKITVTIKSVNNENIKLSTVGKQRMVVVMATQY